MRLLAILVAAIAIMATAPANADRGGVPNDNSKGHGHGAPGPLVAAGLPALIIVGGGYWIFRRLRK